MKTNKTLHAFFAFAPLVLLLLMFLFMGLMFMELFQGFNEFHPYESDPDVPYYFQMMVTAMLAGVTNLVGLILNLMHCSRNIYIPNEKRSMWYIIIALTGVIGSIMYYSTWIAKEDQLKAANPHPFE